MALKLVDAPDTTEIERQTLSLNDQANALVIQSSEELNHGSEILRVIKNALRAIEDTFGPIKKKSHEAWKEIVSQEKRHQEPLLNAEKVLKAKMGAYLQVEERKRREEEARIQELVRKQQEEILLNEAVLAEQAGLNQTAEDMLNEPVFVPPVIIQPEKVSGISKRKNWKFQIVDIRILPREYLIPDEKAIGAVVRAMGEKTNIPGIKIYAEQIIAARR